MYFMNTNEVVKFEQKTLTLTLPNPNPSLPNNLSPKNQPPICEFEKREEKIKIFFYSYDFNH